MPLRNLSENGIQAMPMAIYIKDIFREIFFELLTVSPAPSRSFRVSKSYTHIGSEFLGGIDVDLVSTSLLRGV